MVLMKETSYAIIMQQELHDQQRNHRNIESLACKTKANLQQLLQNRRMHTPQL